MPMYLIMSAMTAALFMLTSLIAFDAGIWMAALWYVIGSWCGTAFLLITDVRMDDAEGETEAHAQ